MMRLCDSGLIQAGSGTAHRCDRRCAVQDHTEEGCDHCDHNSPERTGDGDGRPFYILILLKYDVLLQVKSRWRDGRIKSN